MDCIIYMIYIFPLSLESFHQQPQEYIQFHCTRSAQHYYCISLHCGCCSSNCKGLPQMLVWHIFFVVVFHYISIFYAHFHFNQQQLKQKKCHSTNLVYHVLKLNDKLFLWMNILWNLIRPVHQNRNKTNKQQQQWKTNSNKMLAWHHWHLNMKMKKKKNSIEWAGLA